MQLLDSSDKATQLAVHLPPKRTYHLASYADSMQDVDITDYSFVVDEAAPELAVRQMFQLPGAVFAPTQCLGIVRHACNDDASAPAEEIEQFPSAKHPRRTKKVQFTCNLCGTSNTKAVNPHAWTAGSVFARCEGCQVIHKLTDNLKIFHELSGFIFPPPVRRNLRIPKGLPQVPSMGYYNPIKDNL
ncbi:hypothetical protein WJX72_001513 [[Myrmecia] bisecta]|uniref:DNL-type domain-containing protein n=1 Tax=[Myrmecia] bisecta TaxID=41462 RepID=A0AAW1Q2K8_9CHLO